MVVAPPPSFTVCRFNVVGVNEISNEGGTISVHSIEVWVELRNWFHLFRCNIMCIYIWCTTFICIFYISSNYVPLLYLRLLLLLFLLLGFFFCLWAKIIIAHEADYAWALGKLLFVAWTQCEKLSAWFAWYHSHRCTSAHFRYYIYIYIMLLPKSEITLTKIRNIKIYATIYYVFQRKANSPIQPL